MKNLILSITTAICLVSCYQSTLEDSMIKNELKITKWEMGILADTAFKKTSKLSDLYAFKSINEKGAIKTISEDDAVLLYKSVTSSAKASTLPILEIKNSNQSILLISGKGLWGPIWAHVFVNRDSKTISKIWFDHKSETPGLGAKITSKKFRDQFKNVKIHFDSQKSQLNKDSSKFIPDAISGATITSKGTFMMLEKLKKFASYLE